MGYPISSIAIGLLALYNLTTGSYNIAIGNGAGAKVGMGYCNILVGENIDVPAPETNYYVNMDGTVYPNGVRSEKWFQDAVRLRAYKLISTMSEKSLHGGSPPFSGALSEALKVVDEMSFFVDECQTLTQ